MNERITGRTALVTGAGNGLGRVIALALARAGARVILVGRTREKLESVATEIRTLMEDDGSSAPAPGNNDPRFPDDESPAHVTASDHAARADRTRSRVAVCDHADPAAVEGLARELAGEDVSILVNNAGIAGPVAALVDVEPAEWDEVFAVNVRGVYLMCRAFLPRMTEAGRGDVINLASVSGKRPLARRTPYTASKMAVIGLTTTLAHEVGPLGVNVNSLSPGPVRGPRMARNFRLEAERTGTSYEEAEQTFVSRAALQRMVEEDEVADAVVAMLHMPGLSGADIDLSAGMSAR